MLLKQLLHGAQPSLRLPGGVLVSRTKLLAGLSQVKFVGLLRGHRFYGPM
jgi:hypothetical protein